MPRLLTITILVSFVLGLFVSLWLLSTCSAGQLAELQPFALFHATCSSFGGNMHVEAWTELLLTFTVTLVVTALLALFSTATASLLTEIFRGNFGLRPFFVPAAERTPNMKPWDPLREALAAGVIQRGSRDQ